MKTWQLAFALSLISSQALAVEFYAVTKTDGTVAVMQVMQGTYQEAIAKWTPAEQAKVVSVDPITKSEVPTDRTFRDAWTFKSRKFGVDLAKAKEHFKERMASQAATELSKLDEEATKAQVLGDSAALATINAKRTSLQGIVPTAAIDAAKTTTELKQLWPADLPKD